MVIGDDRPHWGRRLVLLLLLGIGIWLFLRGWSGAASPDQDEVLAAYVREAGIASEDIPDDPLGLIEIWAEERPGLSLRVGDWEYHAGIAPAAGGAAVFDLEPDQRFALVFLELGQLDEAYRGRYYVAASPATPFASMRLYVHELGGQARRPEMRKWGDWGGWDPPDR